MKWILVLTKFTKINIKIFFFILLVDHFQIHKVLKLAYSLKPLAIFKIRTNLEIEKIIDLYA